MERRKPYVWLEQHSRERVRIVECVQNCWGDISGEPQDRGHYARLQFGGLADCDYRTDNFEGIVDGVDHHIHLVVIPLKVWFAKTVYRLTIERTHELFPGWDDHHYEDGPLVGERRLVFDSDNHRLAWFCMLHLLMRIIDEDAPEMSPMVSIQPCSAHGYTALQARYAPGEEKMDDQHRLVTVVPNESEFDKELLQSICKSFETGVGWEVTPEARSYTWWDIADGFVELSLPELTLLNSADARKPITEADHTLLLACEKLDKEAIAKSLEDGADPNVMDEAGYTPLKTLIYFASYNAMQLRYPEENYEGKYKYPAKPLTNEDVLSIFDMLLEAGAHPDLHELDDTPPLADAIGQGQVNIFEYLLQHGADPMIDNFSDSYPMEWPVVWDWAITDASIANIGEERDLCEKIYEILQQYAIKPVCG